jgi:MFS family permease
VPLVAYVKFAAAHRRLVTFGFLAAFASSFGQTYYIGIYGPAIQSEFGLSHTAWGTIYMLGTLGSAALLPWTGKQIDRLNLGLYTALVGLVAVAACVATALAVNPVMLVLAIFLLRQSGQGLMSHVGITSMARYFDTGRGRAIAIATMGFAVGEAILPVAAVLMIAAFGWRWSYGATAMSLAFVLVPAALWLLKGHDTRHRAHLARLAAPRTSEESHARSWTRAEMLRDPRFYLLMPGILAPAVVLTAMFFHHLNLADAKAWSHAWITGSYVVYAIAVILTSLAVGSAIDRFGATRIVPYMLVPMIAAMVMVAEFHHPWIAWPYLFLIGVSTGVAHTAVSAMWAEIYGVVHLGAIRSLATAIGVLGSALGPVSLGGLMDLGISIETGCLLFAAYATIATVLMGAALGLRFKRTRTGRENTGS